MRKVEIWLVGPDGQFYQTSLELPFEPVGVLLDAAPDRDGSDEAHRVQTGIRLGRLRPGEASWVGLKR